MDKHSRGHAGTRKETQDSEGINPYTAESVRKTPINNDRNSFIKYDRFPYGKGGAKEGSDKEQDTVNGYIERIRGW